jgi:hypothetical protein
LTPETFPAAITALTVLTLSALIRPVADIEVVDIFETVIRPVSDAFEHDKLDTNADVELNLVIVAKGDVIDVTIDRLSIEAFDTDTDDK